MCIYGFYASTIVPGFCNTSDQSTPPFKGPPIVKHFLNIHYDVKGHLLFQGHFCMDAEELLRGTDDFTS